MPNRIIKESTYSQKLRDPRWQKKRLEILARDEWMCQRCFDKDSTLAVHHRIYITGKEPWEYSDDLLITLCEECHEDEAMTLQVIKDNLVRFLQTKFFANEIFTLVEGVREANIQCDPDIITFVIAWLLRDPELQTELAGRYFDHLKAEKEKQDNGESST